MVKHKHINSDITTKENEMFKKLALLFGAVFLLVGILGFIPAVSPLHSDGMRYLLGLFMVGGVHNFIHILSGAAAIIGGLYSEKYARLYFQLFGIVYGAVTIIGFIQKTTVLGIFDVNRADNFLHLGLAVVILGIGFGLKATTTRSTAARRTA
jgi:hypothetical protein